MIELGLRNERMGRRPGADHVGRAIAGAPFSMPGARHADIGTPLPALVRDAGLELVDAWAEAPAGVGPGPGPVSAYIESLTEVDLGDDPVVLPPLVTVVARRAAGLG